MALGFPRSYGSSGSYGGARQAGPWVRPTGLPQPFARPGVGRYPDFPWKTRPTRAAFGQTSGGRSGQVSAAGGNGDWFTGGGGGGRDTLLYDPTFWTTPNADMGTGSTIDPRTQRTDRFDPLGTEIPTIVAGDSLALLGLAPGTVTGSVPYDPLDLILALYELQQDGPQVRIPDDNVLRIA